MTSPGPDAPGSDPGPQPPPQPPPPNRPGANTFTIEGRAAPALFVVGWLASLLGLGVVLLWAMSGVGGSPVVLVIGLLLLSVGLISGAGSQGIERRERGVMPYQGPSPLLVFGAAIPVSVLAIVLIAVPLVAFGIPVEGPVGQFASILVQTLVYVGLIRLLVVDTGALSWLEMGLRRPDGRALGDLGTGALWAIPIIVLTAPIALVLSEVFGAPPSPLPPAGETTGFLLQFAAGAIIAPFGEELLFRGLATTAWVRALGPAQGILRAALIFAFAHVVGIGGGTAGEALGLAFVGFATRLPIAIALGWLFVRRGSLWAPIGLHMAFNGILLIAAEAAVRST